MTFPVLRFSGTPRFEVLRFLGAGGMGEVYEVLDRENDARLAAKVMRRLDAHVLYRFKREFRIVQELAHPNLAALGELHELGGLWFFTMELVDGVDFLHHVRDPAFDEVRLRGALRQLCEALAFLHAHGKVHRDVKPTNVLVTPAGRVVLLDFGLVTDADPGLQSSDDIVGTPAYMAPEQAASKAVDASADCYALGTILFEALTGKLPFDGSPADVLIAKQTAAAPDPRSIVPTIPEDLARLCMRLLAFEPARRPTAAEALELLGGTGESTPMTQTRAPVFVGRTDELAVLHGALREALDKRRPRVVHLEGQSGVGKSALLGELIAQLRAHRDGLLVLKGRCFEREMMTYRAFDGVVDAIVRHLWKLGDDEVEWLTPTDAPLLARMFAMFDGVKPFRGPAPGANDLDARTRAYAALRSLLHRLARRWTVVIAIDDLQWADRDSLRLLAELMRGPEAPPALFLLSSRPTGRPGWLAELLPVEVRAVDLAPLPPALAEELATVLLDGEREGAAEIAREAGGHPLHIAELVRHAREGGPRAGRALRLDEAIVERLGRLPPAAREVAELLALAGAPLRPATVRRAADLPSVDFQRALAALRIGFLARRSGSADDELVEPYHDRVREALVAQLAEPRRRALHDALATAMIAAAEPPELLVRHLEGAGAYDRAARSAVEAAQRASASMAYEQAAALYRTAIRLGDYPPIELRDLQLRLGQELINAGHGRDAAAVFSEAAEGADPETRLECHRAAAEQLLITGWIDDGLAAVAALLQEVDTPLPPTPRRALASLIKNRIVLALRGRGWKLRRDSQVSRETLARLDVYKAVSHGLSMVDTIRGADFNARYLRLALATGEPVQLCRALGTEAIFLGSQGGRSLAKAKKIVRDVGRLADEIDSPYVRAWMLGSGGCMHYFGGELLAAADLLRRSEEKFLELRVREGYELNNVRMFRGFSLAFAGAITELQPLYERWLGEAQLRGDLYAETVLRRRCTILWLSRGDTAGAREVLDQASWTPPEGRFHLQHWYDIAARGELALVDGASPGDAARVEEGIVRVRASKLARVQTVRCAAAWLQGRLHLAAGHAEGFAVARSCVARLRRESLGLAQIWANLLAAGERGLHDDHAGAARHLRAVIAAELADTRMYAAVARHRLAPLLGGTEGADLAAAAAATAAELGIGSLDALARLLAPGA